VALGKGLDGALLALPFFWTLLTFPLGLLAFAGAWLLGLGRRPPRSPASPAAPWAPRPLRPSLALGFMLFVFPVVYPAIPALFERITSPALASLLQGVATLALFAALGLVFLAVALLLPAGPVRRPGAASLLTWALGTTGLPVAFWALVIYLKHGAALGMVSLGLLVLVMLGLALVGALLGRHCPWRLALPVHGAGALLLLASLVGALTLQPSRTRAAVENDPASALVSQALRGLGLQAKERSPRGSSKKPATASKTAKDEAQLFPGAEPYPWDGPPQPNVVVILADALRADRVHFLGYRRENTPNLDALLPEALAFRAAFSQSACSRKSIPSSQTGVYPQNMEWDQRPKFWGVGPQNLTLAEILKNEGYDTYAVINPWIQNNVKGFGQGFSKVVTNYATKDWKKASASSSPKAVFKALELLEKRRSKKPFYLFLYLEDAHHPYVNHGPPGLTFGKTSKDRYDSEIAFVDAWAGFFIQYLKERSLWNNTVLLLHSDHGEEFKEHGATQHCKQLFSESVRVPLLLRAPGLKGRKVTAPVALVDLVPTILDLTGAQHPDRGVLEGRSLLWHLLPPSVRKEAPRPLFSFVRNAETRARRHGLVLWPWHLLAGSEGEDPELFNLEKDPGEKKDLAATEEARTETLTDLLLRFLDRARVR
jgi:arylsulfatase A-like enzyme